jgi:hypothetical protein
VGGFFDALWTRMELRGNAHGLSQLVFVAQRHPLACQPVLVALLLRAFDDAERVAQEFVLYDRARIDASVLGERRGRQLHAAVLDVHGPVWVFAHINALAASAVR